MLACFVKSAKKTIPITIITQKDFPAWQRKQSNTLQTWLTSTHFKGESGNLSYIPDETGKVTKIIFCVNDKENFLSVGSLPFHLPQGQYEFDNKNNYDKYAIAWGLGAYQFTRYKKSNKTPAQLNLTPAKKSDEVSNIVESIYLIRDLINTPTDDMGPTELAKAAQTLAKEYGATFQQIIGEKLLKENYASIYTVGRASDDAPRLLDLGWGKKSHPRITLVGKGVCFDSGGLDIKPSSGMLLMKKDMAGAAHVLGLAKMIMQAKLPIQLRVLIPAVENVISGNAYRPGDIITSRKGLTVEIGNTDAEGRVVLSDALTEAASEDPDLIIDMSTLTGAARVAVGTDISAMFCNDDKLAAQITTAGEEELDFVWRLPMFPAYRESLNSAIADINNASSDGYAGAITAALFLKEFVPDNIPWLHFDMMAWNLRSKPAKPAGGEAMAVRALYHYLKKRYKK